jgi:hypothetical protein
MKPGPIAEVAIRNIAPIRVDRVLLRIADPVTPPGGSDEAPADPRERRRERCEDDFVEGLDEGFEVGLGEGLDEGLAMVRSRFGRGGGDSYSCLSRVRIVQQSRKPTFPQ